MDSQDPTAQVPRPFAFALGAALLFQAFLCFALPTAGFASGVGLASTAACATVAAMSLSGGGIAASYLSGLGKGGSALVICASVAAWTAFALLAACVDDFSWDGQTYHLEAVLALGGGWNPLAQPYSDLAPAFGAASPNAPWIGHYPMASWVVGAVIEGLTGSLATTKTCAFVVAAASCLLARAALIDLGMPRAAAAAVAIVAAANPVTLAQLPTNYVDGLAASLLLVLCSGLSVVAIRGAALAWMPPMAACLGLLLNLKFTCIPLAGVLCLCAWLAACLSQGIPAASRRFTPIALAGTLSVLALGYAPYVRNTLVDGHPFHPLMGAGKVDIMGANTPTGISSLPRALRLPASLASRSDAQVDTGPSPKVPFAIDRDEIRQAGLPDTRTGGFGPLFSGALLISLAAFALAWRDGGKGALVVPAAAVLALAVSVAVHPEAWWARYVPQFWLVPCVAMASALRPGTRRATLAGCAVGLVLAADASLVLASASLHAYRSGREAFTERAGLAATGPVPVYVGGFTGAYERLARNGVRWTPVARPEDLPCASPRKLGTAQGLLFCPGG